MTVGKNPRGCGVLRVTGPFAWYDAIFPAPVGHKWIYLTSITCNVFDLVGGGSVALPMPYLVQLPQVREEQWWELQRRIDAMIEEDTRNQKPDKWVASDEPFLKAYPTVHQWCTDCWEKTSKGVVPRQPCQLSFSFFSGSVMVSMNDKPKRRSTNTTAPTVAEALELLEGVLAAGSVPWRTWKG